MGDEEDVANQRAVTVQQQYCIGERNVVHERYKFNVQNQLLDESFDTFYAELRALGDRCSYNYRSAAGNTEGDSPYNEMLRDRIVLGVKDDTVRKKLISHGNTLTLAQAVRIFRSDEVTSSVMQSVGKSGSGTIGVDAVSRTLKKTQEQKPGLSPPIHEERNLPVYNQRYGGQSRCSRCGREPSHPRRDCSARDAECRKCRKVGHYQKQCRSRTIQEVIETPGDLLFKGEFRIGQLTVDAWKAEIEVNGHNTSFKLDTRADGTVISDKVPWLKDIQLEKTNSHFFGPGDQELHVLGSFDAELKYKAWKHKETVFVIHNQATSLLSRKACEKLKLVTYNVKEQAEVTKDMLSKFPELFKGLGKLKDYSCSISLKENYQPVCIYTPRKVPLPQQEKTKRKLEEMVVQD
ncbi:uncharacterized protein [Watersipora subatra]|uniref:uncharacterized protein n=1 Tax=Watersipora subatra TaxID=2589382 RepID=UPI00355C0677